MKNLIIVLCLIFISEKISAQWITQTTTKTLKSVYFLDYYNGWAAGYVGSLLKTTDSGISWNTVDLGYPNDFNKIIFVNNTYGWIVGGDGLILKTTDGGLNWVKQISGVNSYLIDVFFIDENNGWIATNSPKGDVLKTTNGGESWTSYPTGITFSLDICFSNINDGWAGGWGGVIARTSDGGVNWQLDSTLIGQSISEIFFFSKNIGWMVGNSGRILKTDNGGITWNILPFNASFNIFSIYFINEKIGWITGVDINSSYGKIFKTIDGGISWEEEIKMYNKRFYDIFFVDNEYGWAVGSGLIAKYDTTNTTSVISKKKSPEEFYLLQNYPNPFNPSTQIIYSIPKTSLVTIKVYDILGKEVATLVNEEKSPGNYEADFSGKNLASGIYFYRLQAEDFVETKKMTLLK